MDVLRSYIGQALDPNDQYGSGLADLCLTASGVNESNLTVSLEKCAYEKYVDRFHFA